MVEARSRSSGIYGLFCLDGAPVSAADARRLGMVAPNQCLDWLVEGQDPYAPGAIHRHSGEHGTLLLVGEVSGVDELAARIGLRRDAPTAQIAQAALKRFGSDTPAEMLGEWSLLQRAADGKLTLMVGPAMRDRLHYAIVGRQVAVASDLFRLERIGWVGNEVDEIGMLCRWGRMQLRAVQNERTMLSRVKQIGPGGSVVIEPDGRVVRANCNVLSPQPEWKGKFADAVAESEFTLRQIMRERLAGTTCSAVLLSGGLDSSLLAWIASGERGSSQLINALCSAAPAGSGLSDETAFAAQVADRLEIGLIPVTAASDANFFRPPDAVLSGASGPILSNRHCLSEAFQIAAKANGSTLLINGTYGEMTATVRLPRTGLGTRLRATAAQIYHGLRGTDDGQSDDYPFHVRLALHRLANLPEPIQAALRQSRKPVPLVPKRTGLLGYVPGAAKSLRRANEFYPGALRMDFPFRDLRLYRLFAGFPVAMLLQGGNDRPVVRAMLNGHIPDAIRLRRNGMPAEPDRYYRMQRQASEARSRIAVFRKAEIDDWLDLDWLDAALLRVALHGAADNSDTNEVQLTAIAAEFLFWWREQN